MGGDGKVVSHDAENKVTLKLVWKVARSNQCIAVRGDTL